MTAVRILLVLGGIWLAWYGADLVLEQNSRDLMSTATWFLGGILVHDALIAPVCAVVAVAVRAWLPPNWWASIVWGGLCTATLLVISIPVLRRSGAIAGNPTVLDRDYPTGLLVALIVVWVVVALDIARRHLRARTPHRTLTQKTPDPRTRP
ncbi:hypothetical protein [Nocardia sp. NPDC024068]|uniref:hypothetical protein n=1 Tax=Nocardia sp. NPDC024068 TaxID=3157197 RepID=UPI00340D2729